MLHILCNLSQGKGRLPLQAIKTSPPPPTGQMCTYILLCMVIYAYVYSPLLPYYQDELQRTQKSKILFPPLYVCNNTHERISKMNVRFLVVIFHYFSIQAFVLSFSDDVPCHGPIIFYRTGSSQVHSSGFVDGYWSKLIFAMYHV